MGGGGKPRFAEKVSEKDDTCTSRVILVNILFRFLIFLTEYAFLSKYLSKNVQVVIQIVKNKKLRQKPRERQICMETGVSVKG